LTQTKTSINKVDVDLLTTWLKERLNHVRFEHSLGTQQKASELVRNFKYDHVTLEKVNIAGLVHDAAKLMSPKTLFEACHRYQIDISDEERESPQTLHPFVGAQMVQEEFGIDDTDILNAIRYHTTGREGMSLVEKIVYVADKIEENTRNPLYTQKIMKIIDYDNKATLDEAVLYIMNSTITFLIEKGQIIHPRTILARNEMVRKLKTTPKTPDNVSK